MKYTLYSNYNTEEITADLKELNYTQFNSTALFQSKDNLLCVINCKKLNIDYAFSSPNVLAINILDDKFVNAKKKSDDLRELALEIHLITMKNVDFFVKLDESSNLYLGIVYACSVEYLNPGAIVNLSFSPKLSRQLWERFGSFITWKLKLNGAEIPICSDLEMIAAIKGVDNQPIIEMHLNNYDGDNLFALFNSNDAVIILNNVSKKLYLASFQANLDTEVAKECVPLSGYKNSHDYEFKKETIIARKNGIEILLDYIKTGNTSRLGRGG